MTPIFAELRNDHHDDETNCIVIDGWKTTDDNEQGTVVARICLDTYKVWWTDQLYAHDASCTAIVKGTIEKHKQENPINTPDFMVNAAGMVLYGDNLAEQLDLLWEAENSVPDEVSPLQKYEWEPVESLREIIEDLSDTFKSIYKEGFEAGKQQLAKPL
jgi:hypothetical protein